GGGPPALPHAGAGDRGDVGLGVPAGAGGGGVAAAGGAAGGQVALRHDDRLLHVRGGDVRDAGGGDDLCVPAAAAGRAAGVPLLGLSVGAGAGPCAADAGGGEHVRQPTGGGGGRGGVHRGRGAGVRPVS